MSVNAWLRLGVLLGLGLAARVRADEPAPEPPPVPESQPAPESQPVPESRPAPESQPASRPQGGPTTTAAASKPATTTAGATTSTQAAEKEKERFLAVINGRVHTVTGPVLDGATVLSRNGVITAIGRDVKLPQECQVIDARGMNVYPGLVACGAGGIHGPDDPRDTTNLYGLNLVVALAGGITTTASGNNAAKLTWGTPDGMLLKKELHVQLNDSRTQPIERRTLRNDLERVRNYQRELQRHEREKETDPNAKAPDKAWLTGKYETYRKLLDGEALAVAVAQKRQDLVDLAELAQEFGFRLVLRGAYEGWTVAPLLGRARVGAIVTPRTQVAPDDRYNAPNGSTIENARVLHDHGVTVAVVPALQSISFVGLAGRDLLHLNMEAAYAVRGGLDNDAALRTITIDAARVLGVDDRVGSLEVGKDADLIVADGDILHYMTQVHYTVVNGRVAYDKSSESFFRHIRPGGKRDEPSKFDDLWPRRLEWRE